MARSIARPGTWTWRFFSEATPYDLATAALSAVAALIAASRFFADNQPLTGWTLVACAVLACGITVTKTVVAWVRKEAQRSPHLLESSLHVLYEVLLMVQEVESQYAHDLRITVHIPIAGGQQLQQVLDYVGDQRDGTRTAGRAFAAGTGIIGQALREQSAVVARRSSDNYNAYIQELISDWSYTKEQAERLHPGTMAWMAVPLSDEVTGIVEAVLYLDSTDPDFFTDIRQNLTLGASVGIARYVRKAYSS